MASLIETEFIRARWRRHLRAEALDTTESNEFATRGLAARVQYLTFRLLLLPFDPDLDQIATHDAAEQLELHRSVHIGNGTMHFGTRVIPSAHATALVSQPGDDMPWERFIAIHRNGALEFGLGDRLRRHAKDDDAKFVRLSTVASFAWAALEFARHVNAEADTRPRLLAVALPGTAGAFLANLAVGYAEPGTIYYDLPECPDDHLLWHIELDQPPIDPNETNALAVEIASRMTSAWGTRQTMHLDRDGEFTGQLNVRRARQ